MKKQSKQEELFLLSSSIIPSLVLLRKNDPLRLAGATAFFTTFALPFIIFILARFFGLFVGHKIVGHGLINNIASNLGTDAAEQVRQVIHSIRSFNSNWYIIVFGFIFLLFVATSLFGVIKNSLNQIWQVTINENPGIAFSFGARLRSFAAILLVGILFFANLFFKSIETIGGNYFNSFSVGDIAYFKIICNEINSLFIVSAWFIILFRFLADGKPTWKAAFIGGLLTGILFTLGRFILRVLLINSNISHLYGPSGSFVLILLFVFYTSFIMYYGACFIAVYSQKKQWVIKDSR
jgi:membrane protein